MSSDPGWLGTPEGADTAGEEALTKGGTLARCAMGKIPAETCGAFVVYGCLPRWNGFGLSDENCRVLKDGHSPAIGMAWLSRAWLDWTGRTVETRLNNWSANSIG